MKTKQKISFREQKIKSEIRYDDLVRSTKHVLLQSLRLIELVKKMFFNKYIAYIYLLFIIYII